MSGSHFIVYGARHGAKSFFEGISDPTFFMSINRILDEGFYREYFDPRLEKTFSFPGLLEFVTDREGLDIADWVPFMKALRAQDDETAPKVLYWRMVRLDERLDPLTGVVSTLGPPPTKGMEPLNSQGVNQHDKDRKRMPDHNKVSSLWGTSEEYVVRRLKRDAPELADALARGEFPSARAAGIAAGFIKPSSPSLQLKEPLPTAQKLLTKKGKEWCLALMEELSELVF
jgi:hypothetical protein